jgi:dehydrogenase/reductase SDR family protein 7B
LDPKLVARKIISAIKGRKNEVYIGGMKEVSSVYMKKWFPGIFARLVRSAKVR